jgi:mRNA-degrading endonuclease RelE of RelBE toxin-antitoxin system
MKFSIKTIPTFSKELKKLARKYPSIKLEYSQLLDLLEVNPNFGSPLGKDCYKIRLAISSKGKGKRGGARVITCVRVIKSTVYLVAIFDKSEMDNIEDKDLQNRLNEIPE